MSNSEVDKVNFRLDQVLVTSGAMLELPPGGVTVIVGANNAGKSTLLRQINMVLQSGADVLPHQLPRLVQQLGIFAEWSSETLYQWLKASHGVIKRDPAAGGDYFHLAGLHNGNGQIIPVTSVFNGSLHSTQAAVAQQLYGELVFFADAQSRLGQQFSCAGKSEIGAPSGEPLHRLQDNRDVFDNLIAISERVFGSSLLLDDYAGGTLRIRVGKVDLPIPLRNEPLGEFGDAVRDLPALDTQGDGMRSFFGLIVPVITGTKKIVLVDEPEAFLHPPQARALGRELGTIAKNTDQQLVVATHDKDFIAGLLQSEAPLSVARLVRDGNHTRIAQVPAADLKRVWDDRVLRYSNVLDGLFSRLVILCEAEQDCRFYETALESYIDEGGDGTASAPLPSSDVLFIPTNGKDGFAKLIPTLQQLAVPTAVIVDIDILKSVVQTKQLFESLGGNWNEVDTDYRLATEWLKTAGAKKTFSSVLQTITSVLGPKVAENPEGSYDSTTKEVIDELLRTGKDRWHEPKAAGVAVFRGQAQTAILELIKKFDARGLHIVQVGELERFAPALAKNKTWLPDAIHLEAHKSVEAQNLIRRILAPHLVSTTE
ncbi:MULTISPECIES: ATP-dependent endonuclease [unclassified Leucobacter]|uniref:ATP-dependent nuclease n=1 Tax=unclassified Leucobacter TaxID=2621730 RepID=UPI00165D6C6D|nr:MULTISPECIES: AAA family ATPase [unclassified Leucobacter]MBC9935503.1 AAA family ATPase [Leucobacter sp. cx-87]